MIIGLTGKKGAGKDTAGKYLVDQYGYTRAGFADILKEAAGALFDVPVNSVDEWKNDNSMRVVIDDGSAIFYQDMTWRRMLQRFGTEMGRNVFGENFWVDQFWLDHDLKDNLVITDVRFNNEAESIIKRFGCIFLIERDDDAGDTHASEAGIDPGFLTGYIPNNGTIDDLKEAVDSIIYMNGKL